MATDFSVTESFVNTANAVQLHAEASVAAGGVSPWPASFTYVGGSWVYRVDLALDATQTTAVAAAVAAHTPDPNNGRSADEINLRALAAQSSLTGPETQTAVKLILDRLGL